MKYTCCLGDSDINALDKQWKSKINFSSISILSRPTVFFLLLFSRYSTLSVQFTACLHLTKKPALNCKDKGDKSDLLLPAVCVKHLYFSEVKHSQLQQFWRLLIKVSSFHETIRTHHVPATSMSQEICPCITILTGSSFFLQSSHVLTQVIGLTYHLTYQDTTKVYFLSISW